MLKRRNLYAKEEVHCVMCATGADENLDHFFFNCSFAKSCWEKIGIHWNAGLSLNSRLAHARQQQNIPFFMEVVIITAWEIWKIRNDKIFRNGTIHIDSWFRNFKNQCLL
jgi:hypothetical protein